MSGEDVWEREYNGCVSVARGGGRCAEEGEEDDDDDDDGWRWRAEMRHVVIQFFFLTETRVGGRDWGGSVHIG